MSANSETLRIVPTPHQHQLEHLGPTLTGRAEILVLDGDHGTGKTTATTAWADQLDVPVHVLDIARKLSCQQLVRHLHQAVHSDVDKKDLPEREYQDDLVESLASPRVVVVRNVHRLTGETAAQIEWLYSQRTNQAAFVLEGGPHTAKAVARDAMLRGRVAYTITAERLGDKQAPDVVRGLHPMLATVDTTLLRKISSEICDGRTHRALERRSTGTKDFCSLEALVAPGLQPSPVPAMEPVQVPARLPPHDFHCFRATLRRSLPEADGRMTNEVRSTPTGGTSRSRLAGWRAVRLALRDPKEPTG